MTSLSLALLILLTLGLFIGSQIDRSSVKFWEN